MQKSQNRRIHQMETIEEEPEIRDSFETSELELTMSPTKDVAGEYLKVESGRSRENPTNQITLKGKLRGLIREIDQRLRHGGDDLSEKPRAYHFWPGKNVFFFKGRLVCGPDPKGLLLTTTSIVLSSWIFAFYVGGNLAKHSSLIIAISLVLTVILLVNLILVSSTDPGIIPRNDHEPVEEIGTGDGIRSKRVTINGVEMKLKFCRICKIFRPPRSCHCAVCDNCVEKFDHHCPWIGQCVALRNYRFYLTFISLAFIFFVYVFTFSCTRMHQVSVQNGSGVLGLLRDCPETLSLALLSVAVAGFLGGLVSFHLYLVAVNQTAYENFRQRYVGRNNPHDKGVLNNIKEVLFVAMPPSRVDFRAELPRGQGTSPADI